MIKVLVPYDFSEQAQNALNFTTGLADKITGIHVEVIHVMEVPYVSNIGTMGGGAEMPEIENQIFFLELREKRAAQIEELKKAHEGKNYSFNAKLKLGNAFQSISESIVEENPDLVVMGSKGSSGMEEVLIGSNTEKVVRTATCPVVTVKASTDPGSLKKIVFASDFKEDSDEIARRMKNLQGLFNAQLYFVVVNTPANFETTRESIKRINLFAKTYGFEGVKAEIYNSRSEESGIIEFAEDIDADLIAMATHGRTGFLHLITGSIAEDVVNHAKRPVWTLKVK
ncbi:nucleotide-binding universal stress UspA family protein [Algoriphagus iocasae]|uniref:Nucleotide-binding universal stress UspA family protein n=1 Tax=Algoriphagus iocasae TaxID=1836499 RepID=A0A841ME76_9BACT|nr:universal stress protein [Algoriphagus iocasae]MBB6325640.1 nucleotide-binding universal stress UspA family protein [Algoriphagus iocasae]